jgi:tetratricopeptide (TPR) repeat protein
VHGTWSSDTLARSVWCLDERRMEIDALVAELTHADAQTVHRAVLTAAGLTAPARCRDAQLLDRLPPPPTTGTEEVQAVRAALSQAATLAAAGKPEAGLPIAERALARADALGWPPLRAAALGRVALLQETAGRYAEARESHISAYVEAQRAGTPDVAAASATALVLIDGYYIADVQEARVWSRLAEVELTRLGDPGGMRRARLVTGLAMVHDAEGDYVGARTLYQQAVELVTEELGADHPGLATALSNFGQSALALGEHTVAREAFERVLAIRREQLGPDHIDVATALENLALLDVERGDHERAIELYREVVDVRERALGRDHPEVAISLNGLANVLSETGAYDQALALYRRALAIRERALGPDHPEVAKTTDNIGTMFEMKGDHAQARAHHERAIATLEAALGPDHPDLAPSLGNLAAVHRATGDLGRARALFERSLAVRERALGPDHPALAHASLALVDVALAQDRAAEARALAERTVSQLERTTSPPLLLAQAKFELARALWASGEREPAVALAPHRPRRLAVRSRAGRRRRALARRARGRDALSGHAPRAR